MTGINCAPRDWSRSSLPCPWGARGRFTAAPYRTRATRSARPGSGSLEELALEAGKDGQALMLLVRFDAETGKSLGVNASPLWREAPSINAGWP